MKHLYFSALFVLALSLSSLTTFAQSQSREDLRKELEAKRLELETLEKRLLAVADEDRLAYADFLREPDTGLVRLLPREGRVKSLTISGGGAYYSFIRLTHEYGFGSDICLESGYLSVGFAGADYGMLLRLGDVPMDQLNSEYPSARYLSTYTPLTLYPAIRQEQRRFKEGTEINSIVYKGRVPLEVGPTFLLRSISFANSDVLVGFRVLKQDTDGSVILLWKILKRYQTPLIARG